MDKRIEVLTITVGDFIQSNCYLVGYSKGDAFIIDPGADYSKIKNTLDQKEMNPLFIINTHGHLDHIQEDGEFNLPVYIHKLDAPFLVEPELNLSSLFAGSFKIDPSKVDIREIEQGSELLFQGDKLHIIHLPGHTPGGICIKFKNYLFTGDSLFAGSVGRTDFKGGSTEMLISSIREKLFRLDDNLIVLPGHGPASTLKEEKENNPFFKG